MVERRGIPSIRRYVPGPLGTRFDTAARSPRESPDARVRALLDPSSGIAQSAASGGSDDRQRVAW